jgi:ferredoxin
MRVLFKKGWCQMPWIKEDDCLGCGICVKKCPVGAISIQNKKAVMDDSICIRCGVCHDVCAFGAIRHDSEKIPLEIELNIHWVNDLLENYRTNEEKKAFIIRMKKHFNKEKIIAEKTLTEIERNFEI